ncbi:hypothetical protein HF521_015400 [Silurus meridionalis]|uniref:SEA domain-containing protein n=1 Tax=Silurus meridionalis TaxID=175797 RepID=A0A8T0A7Y3_SILME|nr:hypothetical protein HF521_015400 [Silurus meridionalis]
MKIVKFRNGSILTDSELNFGSDGTVPTADNVKSTFVSGLSTLNFTVDPNSISVAQKVDTATTALTTTTVAVGSVFGLTFSIIETFYPALVDSKSTEFSTKAKNITDQVSPLYRKDFNFIRMEIIIFRNGSILTDSILVLGNLNVTTAQMKSTFLNGLINLTFPVDPNSVKFTRFYGNSMPPAITGSLSVIWMSLLFSVVFQFYLKT